MPNIYLSPEDRASNTYAPSALWNGKPTNEKEQMGRCGRALIEQKFDKHIVVAQTIDGLILPMTARN